MIARVVAVSTPTTTSDALADRPDVGHLTAHLRSAPPGWHACCGARATPACRPASSALTSIELHGPLTLGALADHERVAPPSVTKAVAKLEERGLVARQADATMEAHVSITPAGTALLADVRQRKDLWLASAWPS